MTVADRPEDIANRDYYNRTIQFRRVRIVVEADVEWRENQPDYCLEVAEVEPNLMGSIRVRRGITKDVEFVDDIIRDVNGDPITE